jgi:hypothetical protein
MAARRAEIGKMDAPGQDLRPDRAEARNRVQGELDPVAPTWPREHRRGEEIAPRSSVVAVGLSGEEFSRVGENYARLANGDAFERISGHER